MSSPERPQVELTITVGDDRTPVCHGHMDLDTVADFIGGLFDDQGEVLSVSAIVNLGRVYTRQEEANGEEG